jgi:hypothetical protein
VEWPIRRAIAHDDIRAEHLCTQSVELGVVDQPSIVQVCHMAELTAVSHRRTSIAPAAPTL